jgi:hypothetical protein
LRLEFILGVDCFLGDGVEEAEPEGDLGNNFLTLVEESGRRKKNGTTFFTFVEN